MNETQSIHAKKITKEKTESELHSIKLEDPQTLAHAQVKHNLFTTTRNGVSADITVESLDLAALSTAGVAETAEDLAGLASAVFEGGGGLGLETGNGTAELEHGLGFVHGLGLVDDALEPAAGGLDLAGHVGQLQSDDRVVDQALAERLALVSVLDGLLVADAREADALDDDADALVVEVGHDHSESLVLLADQVLHGDLDILEGDIGGATAPDTLAVHATGADTGEITLDEQKTEAVHARFAGADGSGEVVGPAAVGDPLLLAIDNVVLAILGQLGLAV